MPTDVTNTITETEPDGETTALHLVSITPGKESSDPTTMIPTLPESTDNFSSNSTSTEVAKPVTDTEPKEDVIVTFSETTILPLGNSTSVKESTDLTTVISTSSESKQRFISTLSSTEVANSTTDAEPGENATKLDLETTVLDLGSTTSRKEPSDPTTMIPPLSKSTKKIVSTSVPTEVTNSVTETKQRETRTVIDRETTALPLSTASEKESSYSTAFISAFPKSTENFSTLTEITDPVTDTEPDGNATVTDSVTTVLHLGSTTSISGITQTVSLQPLGKSESSDQTTLISTSPENTTNLVSFSALTEVPNTVTDTESVVDTTVTGRETEDLHFGSTASTAIVKESSDPTTSIFTLPGSTKNLSTSAEVIDPDTGTDSEENVTVMGRDTTVLHFKSTASRKESSDPTTLISTLTGSTKSISTSTEVVDPVTDTEPEGNTTVTDGETTVLHVGSTTLVSEITQIFTIQPSGGSESSDQTTLLSTLPENTKTLISTSESTDTENPIANTEPVENATVTDRKTTILHLGSATSTEESSNLTTRISGLPESTKNFISTSTEVIDPVTDAEPDENSTITGGETTILHLGSTTSISEITQTVTLQPSGRSDSSYQTTLISTLPENTKNLISTSTSTDIENPITNSEPVEKATVTDHETKVLDLRSTTSREESSHPTTLISALPESTRNLVSTSASTEFTNPTTEREPVENETVIDHETTALNLKSTTSETESSYSTILISSFPESTKNYVSSSASTEVVYPVTETEPRENVTVDRETILTLESSTSISEITQTVTLHPSGRSESSEQTTPISTLPENLISTSTSTDIENPITNTQPVENATVTDPEMIDLDLRSTTSREESSHPTTLISALSESTRNLVSTSASAEFTNPTTETEPIENATVIDHETTALNLSTTSETESSDSTILISSSPESTKNYVSSSASTEVVYPVTETEPRENVTVDRETTILTLESSTVIEVSQPVTSHPSGRKESSDPTTLISTSPESTKYFSTSDSTEVMNPATYTEPENETVTNAETILPLDSTTFYPICIKPNGFYPTPGNCNTFYKCEKGVPELASCTENNHFNPVKMMCEDPCLAKCDESADCPTTETEVSSESSTSDSVTGDIVSSTSSTTVSTIFTTSEIQTAKTWIPGELISTNDLTLNETSISPPLYFSTDFENISSYFTSEATSDTDISTYEVTTTPTTLIDELTESSSSSFTDGNEKSTFAENDTTYSTTKDYITSTYKITSTSVSAISEESEQPSSYTSVGTSPDIEYGTTETETTYDDIDFRTSDWSSSVSDSTACENGECTSTKISSPLPSSPLPFKLCHRNDFLSRPNCNEYTDCTKRFPEKKECPKGLYFNPTTRVCDWPFNAECGEIAKPLYKPDDSFECPCKTCLIPSTESCSHYYLCLGFTAYRLECSADLLFDTNLNTCNYAPVVSCLLSTTSTKSVTADKKSTDSYTTITSSLATTKAPALTTALPTSSTSKPKKFICPSREGLFKHPASCERFYQCSNWYPYTMYCPATTHFSEVTKRCEYPCDAKCDSSLRCGKSTTTPPKDPRCSCQNCKLPSPETCTKYIVCTNGNARIDSCPWGQTFDARKSSCDWANKVMCNHTEICPERNGMFPFKDDCHKFVHCGNGIPYIKKCPSVLEFDPVKKRCEWPAGRCSKQLPSAKESSAIKEEQHRDGFRCPKTYGYFSDDYNCNKFYHCSYATPTLKECSPGLVYNPKYQTCDWKKHVRCNSNRRQKAKRCRAYDNRLKCPSNRKPLPHTLCNMYYDCTDGRACAKQCPVGLYYNRTTGTCDLPQNVRCYDAYNEDYSLREFSQRCSTHDHGRMRNPSDAACFYHCRQGKVLSGCCSKGHVYNEHRDKCERKPKSLNI